MCQVWLKLTQFFKEEDILLMHFCYFVIISPFPLGKGRGPSFEQTKIPFTQGCFVQSLVEIGPCCGSGEENVKSLRTDDRRLEKLT